MGVTIRPLAGVSFDVIFDCFALGFSDYVIRMQPTHDDLREMLTRRGYVPELSVGAFDGEQMVGFTFNGVDGDRAYDSGTAVIPSHRKQGIARQLMLRSFELLAPRTYTLEVLQENRAAIALYESLGFRHTRPLQVWSFTAPTREKFTELANADLDLIRSWCDIAPSWQNDLPSVRRAREPYVVLGNHEAGAVFFPRTADLAFLAVAPAARLQGLGRRLLNAAATRANRALRVVNIDDRDPGIAAFLQKCGAVRGIRQFEMVRNL